MSRQKRPCAECLIEKMIRAGSKTCLACLRDQEREEQKTLGAYSHG